MHNCNYNIKIYFYIPDGRIFFFFLHYVTVCFLIYFVVYLTINLLIDSKCSVRHIKRNINDMQ